MRISDWSSDVCSSDLAFEIARKGPARPRGIPATETIMSYDVDIGDDIGEVAATSHLLDELALYGYRPFDDEPDPRPLPEARIASGAVADMFDALVATLQDTRQIGRAHV